MVQSSPETGECSQTGHEEGRVDWPETTKMSNDSIHVSRRRSLQLSQMAVSQQGRRKALIASLLQLAHFNLEGNSSWAKELGNRSVLVNTKNARERHLSPGEFQLSWRKSCHDAGRIWQARRQLRDIAGSWTSQETKGASSLELC